MDLHPITGLAETDGLSLGLRVAIGSFFLISGYHKLFNTERRKSLEETFKADGCYSPLMMWAIPLGEFFGGLAIITGTLTFMAALGLSVICLGATFLDGFKRIRAWKPLDAADVADDVLYLPEVLYVAILATIVLLGPGQWSVDAYLWSLIR